MQNVALTIGTPSTKTGSTKMAVTDRIRSSLRFATTTFSSTFGNCIANDKKALAFILEKRRPVKTQSKRAVFAGKKGDIRKTKIEENGHWIAKVYTFDIAALEATGIKINQKARTFTLVDRNNNSMTLQEFKNMNR